MPYFPLSSPFEVRWCPNCELWFKRDHLAPMCAVLHAPGTCCHYGEKQVEVNAEGTMRTLRSMADKLHDLGAKIKLGWGDNVCDGVVAYVRELMNSARHVLKIADTYRGDGEGNLLCTTHSSLPSALEGLRSALRGPQLPCPNTKPAEQGYGVCKFNEGHDGDCEWEAPMSKEAKKR
jgi:hypothetical protein